MSSDYNTIGTLPLGFLASADGNYAPGASSGAGDVAAVFRPRGSTSEVASQINQTTRQDNPPSEEGGYSKSQEVLIDLGPYNERIEDLNPNAALQGLSGLFGERLCSLSFTSFTSFDS